MGADYKSRRLNWQYYGGGNIADITHADVLEHTITKAALGLPENTVAIFIEFVRVAGAGVFLVRTVAAGPTYANGNGIVNLWPEDNNGEFRYALSIANDDWNIHCFGYLTQ